MKHSIIATGLATLVFLPHGSAFLLMNRLLAYERIDPIVQPGIVGGHIHGILGASSFRETFTPAVWSSAKCSTMEIQENKSNYWMPTMMARHDNGSFSALPLQEARTYYRNSHADGTKLTAFPQGFRMVVGDSSRTSPVANDPSFIGYTCQNGNFNIDGLEVHLTSIPDYTCKQFLRAELHFPECWNGRDLDSPDHKSHVAHSVNQACPSTHPVAMAQISLEIGYRTYDYRPDQLLLSTGDQTGYGLHGDYLSFWDVELLQKALDDPTCQHLENIFGDQGQCQTLVAYRNETAMQSCILESKIPQEEVGVSKPVPSLPGCNPPWKSSAGQTKASCYPVPHIPSIGDSNAVHNFNSFYDVNHSPRVDIPVYRV